MTVGTIRPGPPRMSFNSPKLPDPPPAAPPPSETDSARLAREAAAKERRKRGAAANVLTGERGLGGKLGTIGRAQLLGSGGGADKGAAP
jgi:hypothetical protein